MNSTGEMASPHPVNPEILQILIQTSIAELPAWKNITPHPVNPKILQILIQTKNRELPHTKEFAWWHGHIEPIFSIRISQHRINGGFLRC
jgi:hypothetical protein